MESKFHVYDEHVWIGLKFAEKFFLVHDWVYAAFGDDSGFVNDFEGVYFFSFFLHDFPDTSESTFSYDFDEVKVAFVIYDEMGDYITIFFRFWVWFS